MNIKVGEEYPLRATERYIDHNRSYAIGDVYDALVELITNADDSYHDLFAEQKRSRDGGDILIEHLEQRKGQPSYIIVRDKAEGLDGKEMTEKLLEPGKYSSKPGDRGYMGRGAKDCSVLGDVLFESIKEDRYYKCKITQNLKFVLEVDGARATDVHRKQLGVSRGNGTSVTIELKNVRIPHLSSLIEELPWHYALRDIAAEGSDSRVLIRKLGDSTKPEPVVFRPPEGDLVVEESFYVEGYAGARAHLQIWRAPEPIGENRSRFERYGIAIKSTRAVLECSLLADEFRRDGNARRYFGRLECPYIDQLLRDYEDHRKQGSHPPENPRLVIDPNRRSGLERQHPFVQKLLLVPIEKLRALIAMDRAKEKTKESEVANQATRDRLDRLAKLASRFLREQVDELEVLSEGEGVDDEMFAKHGVLIYPTYLNVGLGKERTLTVYVQRSLLKRDEPALLSVSNPEALEISSSTVQLHPHKKREDRLIGSFKVRGRKLSEGIIVTALCNGLPAAEAKAQVVEALVGDRDFDSLVEFERSDYVVRQGSKKTLRLYAKSPDVVASETEVSLTSSDPRKAVVRGKCVLRPIDGTNYAEGFVTVEGRTLKSKVLVTAEINGRSALTTVKVMDKSTEDKTIPLKIELKDKDFGSFRAHWDVARPHVLLISARHPSLARYLGPESEGFPGQNFPHFRVLLAEIVAESVCRKALSMEAKQRPYDFNFTASPEPHAIADTVFYHLHNRMRKFVSEAHAEMLKNDELGVLKRVGDADRAQAKRADMSQGSHVRTAVLGGN